MTSRTLTVTRLVEDHIDGIEIEGGAFGDLLDEVRAADRERREDDND
jgi:hypothetical protein